MRNLKEQIETRKNHNISGHVNICEQIFWRRDKIFVGIYLWTFLMNQ